MDFQLILESAQLLLFCWCFVDALYKHNTGKELEAIYEAVMAVLFYLMYTH